MPPWYRSKHIHTHTRFNSHTINLRANESIIFINIGQEDILHSIQNYTQSRLLPHS